MTEPNFNANTLHDRIRGAQNARARLTAERKMHGATPTNGLPYWESAAIYAALGVAITHLRGCEAELVEQLANEEGCS